MKATWFVKPLVTGFCAGSLALAAAGAAAAQASGQSKPAETPAKKRTFTDTDLEKYKGKGNISQSTLGAPKGKDTAGAKAKSPVDDWFKPNLDLAGNKLKADTAAAYQENEKCQAGAMNLQNRWAELHQQQAKATSDAGRKRIQGQIQALDKDLKTAIDAARESEQRLDACLQKSLEAGVLAPKVAEQYKRMADQRQAAQDNGR